MSKYGANTVVYNSTQHADARRTADFYEQQVVQSRPVDKDVYIPLLHVYPPFYIFPHYLRYLFKAESFAFESEGDFL